MSKIRVHELAKELKMNSKELVTLAKKNGIEIKNHMSALEEMDITKIKKLLSGGINESDNKKNDSNKKTKEVKKEKNLTNQNKTEKKKVFRDLSRKDAKTSSKYKKKKVKEVDETNEEDLKIISIGENLTVKELAEKLEQPSVEIIKYLMGIGVFATINQSIDFNLAEKVAENYDYLVELEEIEEIEEEIYCEEIEDCELKERPPVVVVMGHVDHGKTSLLDAMRETAVTEGEHGGITQHIGASKVEFNNKEITFLDTPGHEAFTAMRLRGAKVTDIAVLVVAADDGVMPQTIEAIDHAKAADIPIIVAINKMDKPEANPERVKQELTEYGLVPEEWGGDTICVPVSAMTKEGIDNLLEMILLTSELLELKAPYDNRAKGTVIEARLDKTRGVIASVLVDSGTIRVGEPILAGKVSGKVRAMKNDKGERVKFATPSTPVEILGFSNVPQAGDIFYITRDERQAREFAEKSANAHREKRILSAHKNVSLDALFSQIQSGEMKKLNIIIKADVQGSVEAVKQSMEKLSNKDVIVSVIHGGAGAVTESDVMLAAASGAIIIAFNVRPQVNARVLAEDEGIDIRTYRVIYNAIEDVKSAMLGMLDPEFKEKVIGEVEVRDTFKVSNVGTIAGGYVQRGYVTRKSSARVVRDGIVMYEGPIVSLKRFKEDVKEVKTEYECGILLDNYNDVKVGDIIEAFIMEEVKRK